jgi:hypothetical protein
MGVQQTFGGSARVLFPLLAGLLFDRMVELPFLVSAAMIVGTIMLGMGLEEYTKPTEQLAG